MINMAGPDISKFDSDGRSPHPMAPGWNLVQGPVEKRGPGGRADSTFPLRCRVLLYRRGERRAIEAWTEEIRPDGFYCIAPEVFAPHDEVECELMIPGKNLELLDEKTVILRCRAEVRCLIADQHISGYGVVCRVLSCKIEQPLLRRLAMRA